MGYETVGEAFRLPRFCAAETAGRETRPVRGRFDICMGGVSPPAFFAPRKRRDGKPVPYGGHPAAASIFSMKMPYPLVGSFTRTWVTAPTSFPSWIIGLPLITRTIPRSQIREGVERTDKS